MSSTSVTNAPSIGSTSITVFGAGFAASGLSNSIRVGFTSVSSSKWRSSSAVLGKVASGYGSTSSALVSVAMLTRAMNSSLSWNTPLITSAAHAALALSGSASVTIMGRHFVLSGPSSSARVGNTACLVSSWNSESSVSCKAAANTYMPYIYVAVSAVSVHRSAVQVTFSVPSISVVNQLNKPTTGAVSVSVFGSNYARSDVSVGFRLGMTATSSSNWVSDSCVILRTSPNQGTPITVTASVSRSRDATAMDWYSDLPTISTLMAKNSPLTGSISISLFGSSFAEVGYSASLRIASSGCESSLWFSSSSMLYKGVSEFGSPSVLVSVERRLATISIAFSFDQHSISALVSGNVPATGRVSITVVGVNFGMVQSSISAK